MIISDLEYMLADKLTKIQLDALMKITNEYQLLLDHMIADAFVASEIRSKLFGLRQVIVKINYQLNMLADNFDPLTQQFIQKIDFIDQDLY